MQKSEFIDSLIIKMTVEQKVAQMMQLPYAMIGREESIKWAKRGIGSFLHVLGDNAMELKRIAMEESELKIPLIFGIDAIHGHALNDKATIFPTQLSMACSFNPELVEKMARATAEEVSADGLNWTFSPVFCLGRDLRWGRVAETFGEDKYLAGELGYAMVKGYQGEKLSDNGSILACAKHFIGYGEATGGRDSYDTEITERKMREEFLPPFERAVDAGCKTFMTAYGSLDGTPCTADKHLLKDILKDELGFDGFVVTDWDNVTHLINDHHVADNYNDASKITVESGNDMIMNTEKFYEETISLVKANKIDISLIDDSVRRILSVKYDLGLFDNPYKQTDSTCIGSKEHLEINRELSKECVVLLKNENNVLPLKDNFKNIAVIGASADSIREHYGDWTYFTHPLPNQDAVPNRPFITFLEGMQTLGKKYSKNVTYAKGCDIFDDDLTEIEEAVNVAKSSDIIFFACGDKFQLTGESFDIAQVELTKPQKILFNELSKLNKPIVLVLIASKPLCIYEESKISQGVITCFNGGMFGGETLAEVIFGELIPSGKLPISFAKHIGEQPTYYNQLSGWHNWRYMDMEKEKSFQFGEGLSYTTFEYSNEKFDSEKLQLTVTLTNTGNITGKETTQVYFNDITSSIMTPIKQLIAFEKTELKPKESKELTFIFDKKSFSLINSKCKRVVENGKFQLMIGSSSKNEDLKVIDFCL